MAVPLLRTMTHDTACQEQHDVQGTEQRWGPLVPAGRCRPCQAELPPGMQGLVQVFRVAPEPQPRAQKLPGTVQSALLVHGVSMS